VRYLCVDLGDKRTGLAVGDAITSMAGPVGLLEVPITQQNGQALIVAIQRAIVEHGPGELVMGLPLNMDGSEGPRSRLVRAFAARLQTASGLVVRFQDERLTSADADWQMARSGLTRGQKKSRRDSLAAATMLSDFLKSLTNSNPRT